MISNFALQDINKLQADGIKLSAEDIIKLNALGLKVERGEQIVNSIFALPRCAYLTDEIILRQPTLEHEIWLDEIERVVDMDDVATNLSFTAFACSVFDGADLPKPNSKVALVTALMKFKFKIRKLTAEQIAFATRYVIEGNKQWDNEYPYKTKKDDEDDYIDESFSIGTGVIVKSICIPNHISICEAKKLTRSQLDEIVIRQLKTQDLFDDKHLKSYAVGDYYSTLNAIKERAINNG